MKTSKLLIKGKVQGVFFRESSRKMAAKLNITGWICNTKEGHVQAIVSGADEDLKEFISWCHTGPSTAIVTEISEVELPVEIFKEFTVRRN